MIIIYLKTITPLQFSSPWTPPSSRLCHTLLQALLGLKHVLFKLIALKCSMRLYNEAFKIGILRRRRRFSIFSKLQVPLGTP